MSAEVSADLSLAAVRLVPSQRWWQRVLRSRNLIIGATVLGMLVLVALLAPLISPSDPLAQDYSAATQPPSLAHPFGTDEFGRDILSRVIYGTRIDLQVGIISVISPFVVGILLGALAAYYGGWIDTLIMRLVDVVQGFPFIVLIVAIVAALGPGLTNMYIAVAIIAWVVYARLIRSEILVEKEKEYVTAARAVGGNDWRVILHHIVPNTITTCVVFAMADIALYILLAASLSFLGLGAQPPSPEWGAMITEGQNFMTTAWWMSALPGLAIIVTGVALSFLGDGLADILRPEWR
ncbi:MAG TPA: ABC transporter permease [Thermomicrobiaceae bacterium]|nr:ABC transporter permease [Thermomicrobiaceae bacterium]